MAPVSSMRLLVECSTRPPSSVTCPSGVTTTTPHPPGPGLPLAAPSVNTTIGHTPPVCSLITSDGTSPRCALRHNRRTDARGPASMTPTVLQYALIALAGMAAGLVNAIAGGGTLLSFPAMTAIGMPAISANVTNTVALWPGMVGGVLAQRRDFDGQRARLWLTVPIGVVGGIAGGVLLL